MDLFEVKLKYIAMDDNGCDKKRTDTYIVEAFNYTDAEATITAVVEKFGMMTAEIKGMKPVKYSDIFEDKDHIAEIWYKVRYTIITVNDNGKEKKTKFDVLVQANSIDDAMKKFKAEMAGTASDWASVAIQETPIVEVMKKSLNK